MKKKYIDAAKEVHGYFYIAEATDPVGKPGPTKMVMKLIGKDTGKTYYCVEWHNENGIRVGSDYFKTIDELFNHLYSVNEDKENE